MGSFFAVQLAVKQMQKQGTPGSVVFIASITAHCNLPGYRMAGYNVSKGGVKMLSKVLSSELAPKGIRVNSISPAFIETNQTRGAREHTTKACGDLMQTAPPLLRIGQPDEVSPAAIFLLSDAAAYITGADILVSGGIHTGRGWFGVPTITLVKASANEAQEETTTCARGSSCIPLIDCSGPILPTRDSMALHTWPHNRDVSL